MAHKIAPQGIRPHDGRLAEGPVTLADLAAEALKITAHCRRCGHWARLDPAALRLTQRRTIPSLEGAFRCTICGSRDTCAMPEYRRKLRDLD